MRMRLFKGLEQDALVLVPQTTDVGDQRDPPRAHRRFQVEKCLQRELVKLRRLVRQQPDLIDRQRLDPVVLPIIRMAVEVCLGKQRCRQRSSGHRLTQARLSDEQVCVRQASAFELRSQLVERLVVACDALERIGHGTWW